jgi:hypothetical protein
MGDLSSAADEANSCKQNVRFSSYLSSFIVLTVWNLTRNIFKSYLLSPSPYKRKFMGDLIFNRGAVPVFNCSTVMVLLFNSRGSKLN